MWANDTDTDPTFDVSSPPDITGSKPARRCSDLLDFENAHAITYGPCDGFEVACLTGKGYLASQPESQREGYKIGFHGTNMYALYSQLFHGALKAS